MQDSVDLAGLYEVDDELQQEVEQVENDVLELLPNAKGEVPSKLTPDPDEEQNEAAVWYQTEVAEIRRVVFWEHEFDGGGHRASIEMRIVQGPNEGREVSKTIYFYQGNREKQARSVAAVNKLLKGLKIDPVLGANGHPNPIESLHMLEGRTVKVRLAQGYWHPWDAEARRADKSQPKVFKRRVYELKAL